MPDNGHMVADRDRDVYDHSYTGRAVKTRVGTRPFPGLKMDIYNEEGKPVGPNEEGFLVIKTPWPAMMRTIYKDPDRYVNQYWSKFPECTSLEIQQNAMKMDIIDHRARG